MTFSKFSIKNFTLVNKNPNRVRWKTESQTQQLKDEISTYAFPLAASNVYRPLSRSHTSEE